MGHRSELMMLKATLIKDPCVSVKRILWSPMVLYLELHIQLYAYFGGNEIHQHLDIDAHAGSVNDLAFCNPAIQLCALPCGHDAPVHSVCPHNKENVHFFFSTSVSGKIKAWLLDNMGYRVDYDAPGHSSTTMAYGADGKRLKLVDKWIDD
ncbi:hypothetical protein EV2_005771 [Malus domestica]